MGCGSGKNNQAVSHLLPLFVCAGAVCHFPTEITHSALVYLINTLSFMNCQLRVGRELLEFIWELRVTWRDGLWE